MSFSFSERKIVPLWQALFILLSTTWLWAPLGNHILSSRFSLISHYEAAPQPYSWIFRLCDVVGAVLLMGMAWYLINRRRYLLVGGMLAVIAGGMALDSIAATTCQAITGICVETYTPLFVVHALESGVTAFAIASLALYDIWKRKRVVSMLALSLQAAYGVLFVTKYADSIGYASLAQFIYESGLILWIAWLCRDLLTDSGTMLHKSQFVKLAAASWAAINGILTILVSLAHIHLLGRINGLYFAGNTAWLAQHGVIVGIIMLYLSRHLARGELRARQIFLVITGLEVLKYSVITPHPILLVIYLLTFVALFVYRDEFDRGTLPLTWNARLKDVGFMAVGLMMAALLSLIFLDRDSRVALITSHAFSHLPHYATASHVPGAHLRSVLLAHTVSVFLAAGAASILWILFRPYKQPVDELVNHDRVRATLNQYSKHSEDYFKLWPADKAYYWGTDGGFIAYKIVGPIAFMLADPIGPQPAALLQEFTAWCRAQRLTTCALPVYETSLSIYEKADFDTVRMGSSAVITVNEFLEETAGNKWWRWQRNRAQKAGYTYATSAPPHSAAFMQELHAVSDQWLGTGGHVERGFSLGYFDEQYIQQCVIHYLTNPNGKVIAFTNQLPQFNPGKMITIDLLRYEPASSNAMPYLLYKTMEDLQQTNATELFDLGFVPFAKVDNTLLTIAKTIAAGRFSAKGLEQFKNKFEPDWQPNYLAYTGDIVDLALIGINLERAMSLEP